MTDGTGVEAMTVDEIENGWAVLDWWAVVQGDGQ